jgi:IS1 family transposase
VKLLRDAGEAFSAYQDRVLRDLPCKRVQVDEIWSFVYAKQKNVEAAKAAPEGAGDIWTWTAIDADTKLAVSWLLGDRDGETAKVFLLDLASRLSGRVQLTSDGHKPYLAAVEEAVRRGRGLRDAGQNLRRRAGRPEALQPGRVRRVQEPGRHRQSRPGPHLDQLRRAPEPEHPNAHPAVHPAHERLSRRTPRTTPIRWR